MKSIRWILPLLLLAVSGDVLGFGMTPYWANYCPSCMMNSPWSSPMFTYSMPSFYPQYSPWWTPYGAMSYPNFYSPGAWSGYGINGGYYPGGGHAFAGKPNIYVRGPENTEVNVKVGFPDGGNLLASVPVHGDGGWTGRITKDGMRVGGAPYEYLFYDFRYNLSAFQNDEGFCGGGAQTCAAWPARYSSWASRSARRWIF
jgi:hypothetical protein